MWKTVTGLLTNNIIFIWYHCDWTKRLINKQKTKRQDKCGVEKVLYWLNFQFGKKNLTRLHVQGVT